MLTSNNYLEYLDDEVAEWCIGGPTPDLYYEAQNIKRGTSYSASFGSTGYYYNAGTDFQNIANISPNSAFWLAGPGSYGNGWVLTVEPQGRSWCSADKDGKMNMVPVVCLKSDTKLIENTNGIYSLEQ